MRYTKSSNTKYILIDIPTRGCCVSPLTVVTLHCLKKTVQETVCIMAGVIAKKGWNTMVIVIVGRVSLIVVDASSIRR